MITRLSIRGTHTLERTGGLSMLAPSSEYMRQPAIPGQGLGHDAGRGITGSINEPSEG